MTSGFTIAAEPIAVDRDANGRHGAVSVSSLSDYDPVIRPLRGGTSPVSLCFSALYSRRKTATVAAKPIIR